MVQLEGLLWASEEPTNEDFSIESKHVELCLMCAWYVHVYTSVYVHCIHGLHSCMCMNEAIYCMRITHAQICLHIYMRAHAPRRVGDAA